MRFGTDRKTANFTTGITEPQKNLEIQRKTAL